MNLHIRGKLLVLIIVPLGVLLLIVASVARVSMHTRTVAAASERSGRALASAQNLLVTLVDAETGMRGYVLTGNRLFTEPYRRAGASLPVRVAELERLSQGASEGRGDVAQVVSRASDSLASIDRYVTLVDRGELARARAGVASGSGKRVMDRFRDAVAHYERGERLRNDATAAQSVREWNSLHVLLAEGSLLAIGITLLLYLTISRSIVIRLQGLRRNANAVAAGNMPHTKARGNDEIAQVERAFHEMAGLLSKREEALVRVNSLQQAILDGTDHGIITTQVDGIITSFNAGAGRMLGYTAEEVVGRCTPEKFHLAGEFAALIGPEKRETGDGTTSFEAFAAVKLAEPLKQHEWTFVRSDGALVPVSSTVTPLRNATGHLYGYLGVSEDITQRKLAEQAVRQSEVEQRDFARQLRSLHLIANTVATEKADPIHGSLRLGLEQLQLDCAYVAVAGDANGQLVVDSSVGASGRPGAAPMQAGSCISFAQAFLGEAPVAGDIYAYHSLHALLERAPSAGHGAVWEASIAAPIFVSDSFYGALGFLGRNVRSVPFSATNRDFVRVIADLVAAAVERAQQRARLDSLAYFDALTGLPNRVLLLDRLAQIVLAAKRYGEVFGLLFLDLDGFKAINDEYGHGVGDDVLKVASRRFEKLMRSSDTVARFGGDEFVVLAPKISSPLDASDLASRLVESMRRPIVVGRVEHQLGVSIGISVFPHDDADAAGMIDSADRALYAAKENGKNRFVCAGDAALRATNPVGRLRLLKGVS